ncbi:MAG: alanyl-tRNA editing protein AlaXM [Candidatus Nanoarchaeia archaeon]
MLYQDDSYLKECEAEVVEVNNEKYIVLNDTIFYPNAGGQPHDTGVMIKDGEEYKVVYVGKFDGKVSHEVDRAGLKKGDKVKCVIEWEKRYKLMRYHTAAHVLSKVIFNETGAVTSGNQLGVAESRIDFTLQEFDRSKVQEWIDKTNEVIAKNLPIKIEQIPREEALKIPDFIRTKANLLQDIPILRVVNIEGFDMQACGGTHVKNLGEIVGIELVKVDNKGKDNRRIYFRLKDKI